MTRSAVRLPSQLARAWFPLGLALLLLLAIPSLVLFGLRLFGDEAAFNKQLQEKLGLSYYIPLPWFVALILLLLPFALVLLYFLKLKRKPLAVPSTFLWKKSVEDLHVNSLFQWLRDNVLLLLQLLALLLLVYAVMDFKIHGSTSEGKHYILMVDNSASMSATDVGPDRLSWAKQEALKVIDGASDQDVGMVVVFNSSAEIRQSYTNNRGLLRKAVEEIQPTNRATRIEEALNLADSLTNPRRSGFDASVRPSDVEPGKERAYDVPEGMPTAVHLFSDGRFADFPDFDLGNLNFTFHAAGKRDGEELPARFTAVLVDKQNAARQTVELSADAVETAYLPAVNNVGIVELNLRRDEDDPTKLQVFCNLLNYGRDKANVRVQLELFVNGQLDKIYDRQLEIPARRLVAERTSQPDKYAVRGAPSDRAVTFELTELEERPNTVVHVRLLDHKDHFAKDDEAWLVVGVVRKARVLVVTAGNDALRAFFNNAATQQLATVQWLAPADLAREDAYRKPATEGAFDLVVFDYCGPDKETDMPRANTFFIGHPPPQVKDGVEKVKHPVVRGWMSKHPVMKHLVSLHEVVKIDEAFQVKELPPRTPRLLESDNNAALMFTLNRQAYTDLVMTFALVTEGGEKYNSLWQLDIGFPLFLHNVLSALGNVSDGASEETVQPGQVKTLKPDRPVDRVEVTNPANAAESLTRGNRADFSYGATDLLGTYKVSWDGEWQRSFAVNLLDADESNIAPRGEVRLGAQSITTEGEKGQPRELWKWLALAIFLLLLLEWYVYNKRVLV